MEGADCLRTALDRDGIGDRAREMTPSGRGFTASAPLSVPSVLHSMLARDVASLAWNLRVWTRVYAHRVTRASITAARRSFVSRGGVCPSPR